MFKLSFGDSGWQAVPRLGIIILIMLVYSFLWHASVTHALADPCASPTISAGDKARMCNPTSDGNALGNSVAASGRLFRHAFDVLLVGK